MDQLGFCLFVVWWCYEHFWGMRFFLFYVLFVLLQSFATTLSIPSSSDPPCIMILKYHYSKIKHQSINISIQNSKLKTIKLVMSPLRNNFSWKSFLLERTTILKLLSSYSKEDLGWMCYQFFQLWIPYRHSNLQHRLLFLFKQNTSASPCYFTTLKWYWPFCLISHKFWRKWINKVQVFG